MLSQGLHVFRVKMCIKHDGKYLQPHGTQAGLTGFCVSSPSPTSSVVLIEQLGLGQLLHCAGFTGERNH